MGKNCLSGVWAVVEVQIGTSDSEPSVGVQATLDWMLGVNGMDKVAGIVGGYHSAIAMPVASNAQVPEQRAQRVEFLRAFMR
eukprot:5649832-Amphidinium_carterae.1